MLTRDTATQNSPPLVYDDVEKHSDFLFELEKEYDPIVDNELNKIGQSNTSTLIEAFKAKQQNAEKEFRVLEGQCPMLVRDKTMTQLQKRKRGFMRFFSKTVSFEPFHLLLSEEAMKTVSEKESAPLPIPLFLEDEHGLLSRTGMSIDMRDEEGKTLLMDCIRFPDQHLQADKIKMIYSLLINGGNLFPKDKNFQKLSLMAEVAENVNRVNRSNRQKFESVLSEFQLIHSFLTAQSLYDFLERPHRKRLKREAGKFYLVKETIDLANQFKSFLDSYLRNYIRNRDTNLIVFLFKKRDRELFFFRKQRGYESMSIYDCLIRFARTGYPYYIEVIRKFFQSIHLSFCSPLYKDGKGYVNRLYQIVKGEELEFSEQARLFYAITEMVSYQQSGEMASIEKKEGVGDERVRVELQSEHEQELAAEKKKRKRMKQEYNEKLAAQEEKFKVQKEDYDKKFEAQERRLARLEQLLWKRSAEETEKPPKGKRKEKQQENVTESTSSDDELHREGPGLF